MSEHKEPIPSMIYNAAVGGHVTNSQQIIDENLNREQNDINQETVGAVPYNSTTPNGMGRIVLKKNDNFKQVVEAQTNGNTIFVVKYDFTLSSNVTIPANCILEFEGGSISGAYTITGNNTGIQAGLVKIFDTNVLLEGSWNFKKIYPQWFGAVGDGVVNDTDAIQKTINVLQHLVALNHTQKDIQTISITAGKYKITNTIELSIMVRIKTVGFVLFNSYVSNGPCVWLHGFDDDWLGFNDGYVQQGQSNDGSRSYFIGDLINGSAGFVIQNCGGTSSTGLEIGERTDEHLHIVCKYRISCIKICGFAIGMKLNSYNHYITVYDRLTIDYNDCDVQVGCDNGVTNNSGENMVFSHCTIATADIGFDIKVRSMDIHCENCSLDGLVIVFKDSTQDGCSSCIDIVGGNIESIGAAYNNDDTTLPPANSGFNVGDFSGSVISLINSTIVIRGDFYQKLFNNNNAEISLYGCTLTSSVQNNQAKRAFISEKYIDTINNKRKNTYPLLSKYNNLILDGNFGSITQIPALTNSDYTDVGNLKMKFSNWQTSATVAIIEENILGLNNKYISYTVNNAGSQGLTIQTNPIKVHRFKKYRIACLVYTPTTIQNEISYNYLDSEGNVILSETLTAILYNANSQNKWVMFTESGKMKQAPINVDTAVININTVGNMPLGAVIKIGLLYLEEL